MVLLLLVVQLPNLKNYTVSDEKGFDNVLIKDLLLCPAVSQEEAATIKIITRDQSQSLLWYQACEWRLTTSNFGLVCNCPHHVSSNLPPSTIARILGENCIDAAPFRYGRTMEARAVDFYVTKHTEVEVKLCGSFMHTSHPFLGYSPDRVLCTGDQPGVLEVKTP